MSSARMTTMLGRGGEPAAAAAKHRTPLAHRRTVMRSRALRMMKTLLVLIAGCCGVLPTTTPSLAQPSKKPPHIVLFIADDFSWHDSGAYGSKDARTPRIDALAKTSLEFNAA